MMFVNGRYDDGTRYSRAAISAPTVSELRISRPVLSLARALPRRLQSVSRTYGHQADAICMRAFASRLRRGAAIVRPRATARAADQGIGKQLMMTRQRESPQSGDEALAVPLSKLPAGAPILRAGFQSAGHAAGPVALRNGWDRLPYTAAVEEQGKSGSLTAALALSARVSRSAGGF